MMTIVLQTMSIDEHISNPPLRRLGAHEPIMQEQASWRKIEDAIEYFQNQKLSNIQVLHNLEIESCLVLMTKLDLTREELAGLIDPMLCNS